MAGPPVDLPLQSAVRGIADLRCRARLIRGTDEAVDSSLGDRRDVPLPQRRADKSFPGYSPSGIYSWRRFTEVFPATPPRAGTGRTFIPLILARPHADLPIPARGGEEMAP